METNPEVLQIISNETKNSIGDMSIVTPTIYSSIFSKYAISHNTNLNDEDKVTNNFLDKKISQFRDMQIKTSDNAIKLSEHTTKAITAIKDKDESVLMEVLKETQELRREIEKLKESVYKDELTHIYNRKWFHDNFIQDNTEDFKIDGTLAIIDLNYFKLVNDTYGHIIGDKVLIFIANQLKKTKESVVRYGGDEFLVMFPSKVSKRNALMKLNHIREDVITKKLKAQESSFKVSFSFGVHEFKKGEKFESVIEIADKNMYNDKVQIKNKITGI